MEDARVHEEADTKVLDEYVLDEISTESCIKFWYKMLDEHRKEGTLNMDEAIHLRTISRANLRFNSRFRNAETMLTEYTADSLFITAKNQLNSIYLYQNKFNHDKPLAFSIREISRS